MKGKEKESFGSRLKKAFTFRTISSRIGLATLIFCFALLFFIKNLYSDATSSLESSLIGSKLNSDIIHLEDIIVSGSEYTEWHIVDGDLYCGDVCLGNGTEEKANLAPFLETERKTGTFCYTFINTPDAELKWYGDSETGYQEGHFLRVAGSTKDPNGNSIVGTYIDKKISDVLDEKGTYEGVANVVGGQIYCVYNTLMDDSGNVVGAIVVGRSINELQEQIIQSSTKSAIHIFILIMLCGSLLIYITTRWTRKISKIEKYLRRIENGELPEDKLKTNRSKDEINDMVVSVNDMVSGLKEKERIGAELSVATNIQVSMLPKIFPTDPKEEGYNVYATMHPAKEVGGDLYDFFRIDDRHIAFVIADVSGKGVPAALFMAISKAVIKNNTKVGMEPSEVFYNVNNILCDGNEQGLFVTALMGIIDLKTGIVKFANAGHNPPLISKKGVYEYIKLKPGIAFGVLENMKYTQTEIKLKKSDRIFFYTDGVTEDTNINDELYGEDRLLEFLNSRKDEGIKNIVDDLNVDLHAFSGSAPQFDDITILMLEYVK